jgi:hypothetical protein
MLKHALNKSSRQNVRQLEARCISGMLEDYKRTKLKKVLIEEQTMQ